MKKSRLLDSPISSRKNNLRIEKNIGGLIPKNNYILDEDAEYEENKRIAHIFLRLKDNCYNDVININ